MSVLVTGFDPFGKETINPSFEAVKRIKDVILGERVVKVELPTVFNSAKDLLVNSIRSINPKVIICVGQAGGRSEISLEKFAINARHARIEDNQGQKPEDEVIRDDGPLAYRSTLPLQSIVSSVNEKEIPCKISYHAGTFVCNEVLYSLLDYLTKNQSEAIGGFVHVPYLPSQVKQKEPSLTIEQMVEALEIVIETSIKSLGG